MLTGVSLFAGVGGFDLAMQRKGVKVVASVEIDSKCNEVLAKHFPEATQFTDVTTVKGEDLINAGFTPSTGIITGGFPCQDLSVAGKRAGLAGERSGLFWEIARLVEETQTEYFVIENVPGLLTSNKGRDFGVVIGTMADLGYSLGWRVLDAQYFGVPQRRRRIFIVGKRTTDGTSVAEILFKSEGLRRDPASSEQARQDTTPSTARSFGAPTVYAEPVGTLQARDYKGVGNQYVSENKLIISQVIPIHDKATRFNGKRKLHNGDYIFDGAGNGLGVGKEGDPMNTLTKGDRHAVVAQQVRRLTPVECERLQGFPDGWTEGQSDTQRYKQMGNAVAVPVVEWIIGNICDSL